MSYIYEKRGTFSIKKNTTAWSSLITYTVHLSVRLRVNRGRKIKPGPNSHQISWSLINNVFGIKLRLHKKTIFDHCKAITTLYTRVCLLQKPYYCQSSHTARSCNPQQNTRPIYFSWIIWLFYQQRSGSVRSCTVQSDLHVWIRKVITSWCPAAAIVAMISLVVDIIWIHKQWDWTQSSAGFNCVLSDPLTKQYEGPAFLTLCWRKP